MRRVLFDGVWKRFRRGERHTSLRDLIPAMAARLAGKGLRRADADAFWAIEDVSFEVQEGEALGIIGRNGAGKSTALKLLTRILKPTQGHCAVVGRAGALIEVAAGFHPDLTGRENVFLQGAIMGMKRHEIATRFDEIVAFAGVERFIDTPVKRYSSGMNARLGFSIAAHLRPNVLLIDEVLSVGDLGFQQKCQERMQRFKAEGVAIVFVSHHLPAVAQLCTRVLLLEQGRAAQLGSPSDVIATYCSGAVSSVHEDITLTAVLTTAGGTERYEVQAGEQLTLDVTVGFDLDVDAASIGIVVWDLARDLYVYGISSEAAGVAPIAARRGETRGFAFSFAAHLTRGVYAIEVNVVDHGRHKFLAVARGICHFRVVEHQSYDGVANLYLSGRDLPVAPLTECIR